MTNELFEKYWANVRFCFITFLLAVILIGILSILFFRKRLPFKILLLGAISMGLITLFLVFAYAIPCAKDYEYVKKDECIEIYGRVTEFTKRKNSDGEIIYSRPKFLIVGTDEYIVFPSCTGVEIGKTYKIQYLPNTKLCKVIYTYD